MHKYKRYISIHFMRVCTHRKDTMHMHMPFPTESQINMSTRDLTFKHATLCIHICVYIYMYIYVCIYIHVILVGSSAVSVPCLSTYNILRHPPLCSTSSGSWKTCSHLRFPAFLPSLLKLPLLIGVNIQIYKICICSKSNMIFTYI